MTCQVCWENIERALKSSQSTVTVKVSNNSHGMDTEVLTINIWYRHAKGCKVSYQTKGTEENQNLSPHAGTLQENYHF